MSRIHDVGEGFLQEQGWAYESMEDHDALRFGLSTENTSFQCYVQIDEQREQTVVYACMPNHAEDGKREAAAEFVARANYGMRIGNFELDLEDGEVRFKVSVDVEGSELSSVMVRNMIACAITCADRYYPGLMQVLYGNASPKAAVEQVETIASIPDEM